MMKFKKSYAFLFAGVLALSVGAGLLHTMPETSPVKAAEGDVYNIVTSEADLVAGDSYLIARINTSGMGYVMADQGNTGYRYRVGLPTSNLLGSGESRQITWYDGNGGASGAALGDHFVEFVLGGESGKWTFQDSETNAYLVLNSNGNNIHSSTGADSNGWSITINPSSYEATISPNNFSDRSINYNSSSPRFACYKPSSNQQSVTLFRKSTAVVSSPTVNVSGTTAGMVGAEVELTAVTQGFSSEEYVYNWTVAEGSEALISLANETAQTVTVSLNNVGTATINLEVTAGEETANTSVAITINDVLTVAEAKALEDGTNAYVRGIVYAKYGSSYYIADSDGAGMQLFTYSTLNVNLGDQIVVNGETDTYNSAKQLANPVIMSTEATGQTVTPKTVTYDDLNDDLLSDYIAIENMVWHSGAASTTNIHFYENGDSSKDLVLYNHSSNSADYESALATAMTDWQEDVTTVTLTGVYARFNQTLEINLTSASTYEVDKVETFARSFLANLTCDPDGVTAPSTEEWNALADEFALLSEEEKAVFTTGEGASQVVNEAIAKYDYVMDKYGDSTYTNFMNRTLTENVNGVVPAVDQTNNIIIIVSVCVLALSAIAVFVIVYRRKRLSK